MRIISHFESKLKWVLGLVVLTGLLMTPGMVMAGEKDVIGTGVVQGDPGDALEGGGLGGDVEDGLDGPVTRLLGDPGDGTDLPGDPDDALGYFQVYCDPGDFVLGYEDTLFFGYFCIP